VRDLAIVTVVVPDTEGDLEDDIERVVVTEPLDVFVIAVEGVRVRLLWPVELRDVVAVDDFVNVVERVPVEELVLVAERLEDAVVELESVDVLEFDIDLVAVFVIRGVFVIFAEAEIEGDADDDLEDDIDLETVGDAEEDLEAFADAVKLPDDVDDLLLVTEPVLVRVLVGLLVGLDEEVPVRLEVVVVVVSGVDVVVLDDVVVFVAIEEVNGVLEIKDDTDAFCVVSALRVVVVVFVDVLLPVDDRVVIAPFPRRFRESIEYSIDSSDRLCIGESRSKHVSNFHIHTILSIYIKMFKQFYYIEKIFGG